MYGYNYAGRAGAGGGYDLPHWQYNMPGAGTNYQYEHLNIANEHQTLPYPYMGNQPGTGFDPGAYQSPSYMYPSLHSYMNEYSYPPQWGPYGY
ncbi:hypothetical protein PG985_000244 [Apiospora marii]|uniref:uncharacterized protein n=1 Tax=Apiospora marii TaxID=335849 RepID=UPI00312E06D1